MRLYELTDELAAIDAAIDEANGELSPELEAALDAIKGEIGAKVDGIAAIMRSADADAKVYREEARLFAEKAQAAERKKERLSGYVKRCLESANCTSVQGRRFTVRIQKNAAPSIRWPGAIEALPAHLKREIVEVDGKAVQNAHRLNALPAGFVVEYGTHVRIS